MYHCLSSSTLTTSAGAWCSILKQAHTWSHSEKKANFKVLYFMATMLEPCSADLLEIFHSSYTQSLMGHGGRWGLRDTQFFITLGLKKVLWKKKGQCWEEVLIANMTLISHLKLVERSLNAKIFICDRIDFQSGHITLFRKVNPTHSYCTENQNTSSLSFKRTEREHKREMEKLTANFEI